MYVYIVTILGEQKSPTAVIGAVIPAVIVVVIAIAIVLILIVLVLVRKRARGKVSFHLYINLCSN